MAIAKITLTCSACGAEFTHRRDCWNRTDANNYEAWAQANISTCPACYHKQQVAKQAETLAAVLAELDISLPELHGVSDKQIAYADKRRTGYLASSIELIKEYHEFQVAAKDEEKLAQFAPICAEHGMTIEEGLRHEIEAMGLDTIDYLLTSTSAADVLDRLAR